MNDNLGNPNDRLDSGDFIPVLPDENPNFDEERNRRIIESVKQNNIKNRLKKLKGYQEGMEERADTLSHFFVSEFFQANKSKSSLDFAMKRYFGPKEHEHLTNQLRMREEDPLVILDKMGNIVREKGFDGTKTGQRKKKKI